MFIIISALRNNRVELTAEFNPAEGRYFQTGHRANRADHECEVIFDQNPPEDLVCPICGKKMNLGVQQRCLQLQDKSIVPRKRKFKHLIPLVEVIANSFGVKSVSSSKVIKEFNAIMDIFPSEISLWQSDSIQVLLDKRISEKTINRILAVQQGDFGFDPPGFDGLYGCLKINE